MRRFPLLLSLAALCWACQTTPTDGSAASRPRLPRGCEQNLSGSYRHAEDPSYRYLAEDEGDRVILRLAKPAADGGTATAAADGGTYIYLARSADGFGGRSIAVAYTAQGKA